MDKEFTPRATDALPTFPIRPPMIATGPMDLMQEDGTQYSSTRVLDIRPRNQEDPKASEESSIHTGFEQKIEPGYVV